MSNLQKGANVAITKENPDLKKLTIGISYSTKDKALEQDLLTGLFLCGEDKKALRGEELVFFNQLKSADGSVEMGDDITQIDIDLNAVPSIVQSIDLVVWDNSGKKVLKQLSSLYARFINHSTGQQLLKTEEITQHLTNEKALCLVQVYRYNGTWKVRTKAEGWSSGLSGMLETYGLK